MLFEKTIKETKLINFKVTAQEKEVIKLLAKKRNLNISKYLKQLILEDFKKNEDRLLLNKVYKSL